MSKLPGDTDEKTGNTPAKNIKTVMVPVWTKSPTGAISPVVEIFGLKSLGSDTPVTPEAKEDLTNLTGLFKSNYDWRVFNSRDFLGR